MAVYEYGIYIYEYKDIVNNTINEQDNTNCGLITWIYEKKFHLMLMLILSRARLIVKTNLFIPTYNLFNSVAYKYIFTFKCVLNSDYYWEMKVSEILLAQKKNIYGLHLWFKL